MQRLAASLCVACCVAQTQNPACERAAAATGGLIAWNATAKRCEPDVCDGSPEGILDFFATPPPPAEGQHYVKKLGAGFCDHVQTESAYARWRPGFVPSRLACGQRLFDAPAARSCLAKKRVVFLGDSTLTEVVHGLVMTLFGDGTQCGRRLAVETRQKKKPTRREKRKHRDNAGKHRDDARPANPQQCGSAASYLKRLASVMKLKHTAPYHSKPLAFDRVTVKFEGAGPYGAKNKCARPAENRRFSAKFGDVLLQHRWTGATNPCNRPGGEGLSALVDGKLGAADLFLDNANKIDAVVVASGVHDLHLGPWDATAKSAKIAPRRRVLAVLARRRRVEDDDAPRAGPLGDVAQLRRVGRDGVVELARRRRGDDGAARREAVERRRERGAVAAVAVAGAERRESRGVGRRERRFVHRVRGAGRREEDDARAAPREERLREAGRAPGRAVGDVVHEGARGRALHLVVDELAPAGVNVFLPDRVRDLLDDAVAEEVEPLAPQQPAGVLREARRVPADRRRPGALLAVADVVDLAALQMVRLVDAGLERRRAPGAAAGKAHVHDGGARQRGDGEQRAHHHSSLERCAKCGLHHCS